MNIRDEYARLEKLSRTDRGWGKISDAWFKACNYRKVVDGWQQRESAGNKVEGFAIDSESKKFFCGTTSDHGWASDRLYDHLYRVEDNVRYDDLYFRIIKGWRGSILDFGFPCIQLSDPRLFHEPELLEELEEFILEQGVGLPLNRLFMKRHGR